MVTAIVLLVLTVIILSGLFSGTEAALLSVTPSEVEVMVQNKKRFSQLVEYIKSHLNRSVTAILIMNNIVNIAGSIWVGHATVEYFGSAVLGVMTTAFTFAIIIFSEIIPKSIATKYARTVSRLTSPGVACLTIIFSPIILPLEWIVNKLLKGERKIGTEAQIRSLVRIGRKRGHIEQDEGQLIHRVFHLNDVHAKQLMTPLREIVAFPAAMSAKDVAPKIIKDPHSRFPIYGEDLDDIHGIILETEILAAPHKGEEQQSLSYFARPAIFTTPETYADDLLILFRDERTHMAIVQEKGKHTVGVVTLEDVLEELVGEIEDERDVRGTTT